MRADKTPLAKPAIEIVGTRFAQTIRDVSAHAFSRCSHTFPTLSTMHLLVGEDPERNGVLLAAFWRPHWRATVTWRPRSDDIVGCMQDMPGASAGACGAGDASGAGSRVEDAAYEGDGLCSAAEVGGGPRSQRRGERETLRSPGEVADGHLEERLIDVPNGGQHTRNEGP